jgi:hypothetical protein
MFSSLLFSSLLFLMLLTTSCEKEQLTAPNDVTEAPIIEQGVSDTALNEGMIQLGKKLENPYSVENMRKAYQELISSGVLKSSPIVTIETTHLYVRFLPKDTAEYFFLERNYDLLLYDYPLDYEITHDGSYYHDPSIPQDQFTWFYTTVGSDFEFPDVAYQILAECFIPQDDGTEDEDEDLKSASFSVYDKIEDLALQNAGYLDIAKNYGAYDDLKGLSRQRPKGTIQVWDNRAGRLVPVRGVTIRCQLGVNIHKGTTDANGYYSVDGRFRLGPHYRMFFQPNNGTYLIRNVPQAIALRESHSYGFGYHNKRGHSRNISASSSAAPFCIISNAAFDYYAWCRANSISLPPNNITIWATGWLGRSAPMMSKVHHSNWLKFFEATFLSQGATQNYPLLINGVRPDITLNVGDSHLNIYRATCHELAHASHFSQVGSSYWVSYISYIILNWSTKHPSLYGDRTIPNSGVCGVGEMWGFYVGGLLATRQYAGTHFNGVDNWFEPRILRQLTNNAQSWLPRLSRPLTEKQIFDCLTRDIRSHEQFKNRLILRYEREDEITAVFAHFGF